MKKWIIASAIVALGISVQADITIADVEADYKAGTMATGWNYGWNATGVALTNGTGVLNRGSFTDLVVAGTGFETGSTAGTANYTNTLNAAQEDNTRLRMDSTGDGVISRVHGGADSSYSTDGFNHYIVMSYTLQAGEGDLAGYTDYEFRAGGSSGGASSLLLFVNDELVDSALNGDDMGTVSLGVLSDSDVVSFAYMGDSSLTKNKNRWYVESQIVAIPEPATLGLVSIIGAGLVIIRRRIAM